MDRRPLFALCRCLVFAAFGGWSGTPALADGNETDTTVFTGVRRQEQSVEELPGVEASHSELGLFRASLLQKSQIESFHLGFTANGEGGRSQSGSDRYLVGTVAPNLAYEDPRQAHHLRLSLTRSYDSQGMTRSSLREQVDAAGLTDEQKKRFTQAGVDTDHYFSLDPLHSLILFLSGSSLDREILTKTYVGGGFLQREMSPLWKLRLGGSALRVIYDGQEIRASGPEVQSLHEWSEAWLLTLKVGLKEYKSDAGDSTAQNGGATLEYKRGDDHATLGVERSTGNKPVTAEVTTSDVTSAKGHVALAAETALEADAEQRLEHWISGIDEGSRAETTQFGMTFVFGWGGRSPWQEGRSRYDALFSLQREDLRVKSGVKASRQTATAGLERVF